MPAIECRSLTGRASALKRRLKAMHAGFTEQNLRTECLAGLADLEHLTALLWSVESTASMSRLAATIDAMRDRVDRLEGMLEAGVGPPRRRER